MNSYKFDSLNQALLLSSQQEQVMMEWEKPYMERCIDVLNPEGDVLEIGFGLGYSADQIQTYNPQSHTIIECDPIVLEKLHFWAQNKANIRIIEGRWQEKMSELGVFDQIFMDDYPLNINQNSSILEKLLGIKRFNIFIDLCIRNHTRIGSRISGYLANNIPLKLGSDSAPFTNVTSEFMVIQIPKNCTYRSQEDQRCQIPLIIKTSDFNFQKVSQYALNEIKTMRRC